MFGLAEKNKKKGFEYPVFDIEWVPTYAVSKGAEFSKKYLETLKKLAKECSEFTVATDYDIEGEVIGLNIVRFVCNKKDARRMKFSTLTKPDIVAAYGEASPHLDWGQAMAGETRHFLDYFYGINISRALTKAISAAGTFKILSTGRVQGPALKIIVDKEREIKAFVPVPFWQVELNADAKNGKFIAWHVADKFWKKHDADKVISATKGQKDGIISAVEKREFLQRPPVPFDLTSLQTESYRCFGISPKATLAIAQGLYTAGFISYPRTSSQQLPPAIGFSRIMKDISKQSKYRALAESLLKLPKLEPNNGEKTDPAHPALYPTGIVPEALDARQEKVYDIIVKRFLATFGPKAKRETMKISIDVNKEIFVAQGSRTVEKGWHVFYAPYVKLEEAELPLVEKNEHVKVKKIVLHEEATQPPKRYTPSSIIKELEKRNLGTKATRAEIVDTLYKRNYVKGEAIEATEFGVQTIQVLEKHCPRILDEELTRHFEIEMEEIRAGKSKPVTVLAHAKEILKEILHEFKHKEKTIGNELKKTLTETKTAMITVGSCPNCKKGMLQIRRGKFGRFIACERYPDCKHTYKLPVAGLVEVLTKTCEKCHFPMIKMIRKAKRPQEVCINTACPLKKPSKEFKEHPCHKCKEGTIILRTSVYGSFAACNKFPKCRFIERL
ncbi:DNA topoisomerase I [Candidatus Woesearchaeota archaeon]|nr:DNA topoisomerase I [Candidatus Woesearchaeota archaeon]